MEDLTDAQVANYLRAKAEKYLALAADLEKNGGSAAAPTVSAPRVQAMPNRREMPFEELMAELQKQGGRVKYVAARLNISEQWLRDMLSAPNSKFRIAERGWIKPKA